MSNNGSKPLMLMFTIGPVQSFIEASRKTEDLWMSSYILSYLVATAMDKVIEGGNVELIYPAIGTKSPFNFWKEKPRDFTTPSFPNLFLAIGNGIQQTELGERAKRAEESVATEFKRMAKCAVDAAFDDWCGNYAERVFDRQISDFFDAYWVITEEAGADYGAWYEYTASSLAAIKNCRIFKQTEEFGRKCSLEGTREILHKKEGRNEREQIKNAMDWWGNFAERSPQFCRPKEALCAISLTKRMGRHYLRNQSIFKDEFDKEFSSRSLNFPSTSEVATAAFKERLQCKPSVLKKYKDFCGEVKKLQESGNEDTKIPTIQPLPKIKCLPGNNVDGEWLYEETWSDSYLIRYYNIDVSEQKHQIKHCKKLRREIVQSLDIEPGKYYAAIALDADNMGEKNREAENANQHKKHSLELIEYTETARRIVEQDHLGKLTYAGGDDLLALANLKDILPILKKLREEFPGFTEASAGVCIAHNKMPLSDVLKHARRMEAMAKEHGRNSLGIALFKHSGNFSEMVTKWKYPEHDPHLNVLAIAEQLVNLLRDDEVSRRFLYNFRATFLKLTEHEDDRIRIPPALVATEFRRLVEGAYKRKEQQLEAISQDTISNTTDLLSYIRPFTNYLGFLEIINFIARESK